MMSHIQLCPNCEEDTLTCASPARVYQQIYVTRYKNKTYLNYEAWDSDAVEFTDSGQVTCDNCDFSCSEEEALELLTPPAYKHPKVRP